MRRILVGSFLFLLACSGRSYYVDFPDQNLPLPGMMELERRVKSCRSGEEPWHADPRRVAHMALLQQINIPVHETVFRSGDYEFHTFNSENPEWGSYVVTGWRDRAGRAHRCRVRMRAYENIWYAVQVSRYMAMDYVDERDVPGGSPPQVGH